MNDSQRRALSIALSGIERDILLAQQLIEHPPPDGTLTRHTDPLPQPQDDSLNAALKNILAKITQLTEELQLEPREEPLRRMLVSRLLLDSVALEEVDARRLSGYGAVHPLTVGYLQKQLPELRDLVNQLLDRLGATHQITRLKSEQHP